MNSENYSTKSIYIKTFGCQMNFHDSDIMQELLLQSGYEIVDDPDLADTIIFNTCTVRDNADHKFYSELGRYSKDKKIIVAGCLSQVSGDKMMKRAPFIHAVIGPQYLYEIPSVIKGGKVLLTDCNLKFYSHHPPLSKACVTASISIMYGCSRFCSYCIVPFSRGKEISRKPDDIYNEISIFAANGVKEITLLGQNVNAYRYDGTNFQKLLKNISKISRISRIRFISPHPSNMTDDQISTIADLPKCIPHIHLPLQSGSDRILKLMKRGYSVSNYIKKVEKIEKLIKDAILTTDIIVGFPTETESDFNQTLKIVRDVGFLNSFMFCYSKRRGTAASDMEGQVDESVSKNRLIRLIELQQNITEKKLGIYKDRLLSVFVDKFNKDRLSGRTRQDIVVNLDDNDVNMIGKFFPIMIDKVSKHTLHGHVVYGSKMCSK